MEERDDPIACRSCGQMTTQRAISIFAVRIASEPWRPRTPLEQLTGVPEVKLQKTKGRPWQLSH